MADGTRFEITLDTRKLDEIAKKLDIRTDQVIKNMAFDVEAEGKMLAPVKTGAMRNSIYTASKGDNSMPAVQGEAERVVLPTPMEDKTYHVGPSVNYGVHVEFGTRFMHAQPYLIPAFEHQSQRYQDPAQWKKVAGE